MKMTRTNRNKIIIWAWVFTFLLFMPKLCAQTSSMSSEEALELRQKFVDYGKKYIGCPYVSGATGPVSFDCSGFVYAVARESIGYQIPRMVKNIYKFCQIVEEPERQIGDLVFFKTIQSDEVSHVGIYIGNGQFLNCASDGPNTGVILSSLNENYWKSKYYKTARFLPPADKTDAAENQNDEKLSLIPQNTNRTNSNNSFLNKILLEGIFSVDWNFYTPDTFKLNFRGLTATVFALYDGKKIKPGIMSQIRWNYGTQIVQFPLAFCLSMSEYFKIYAGPVFAIGTPKQPGNSSIKYKTSIFPGILGVSWNTPSYNIGKFGLSFAQDIHYTIYNDTDGSALSPLQSIATGLVFSSGIRVTFPL